MAIVVRIGDTDQFAEFPDDTPSEVMQKALQESYSQIKTESGEPDGVVKPQNPANEIVNDTQPVTEDQWWGSDVIESLKSMRDDTVTMYKNFVPSTLNLIEDVSTAVMNPIDTAANMGRVFTGLTQKLVPGVQGHEQYADAMGQALYKRYGSMKNMRNTALTDPAGFASDLAGLTKGVAGMASKIAPGSRISKIANAAKVASIDPVDVIQTGIVEGAKIPFRMAGRVGSAQFGPATGLTPAKVKKLTSGKFFKSQAELTDFANRYKLYGDAESLDHKLASAVESNHHEVSRILEATPGNFESKSADFLRDQLIKYYNAKPEVKKVEAYRGGYPIGKQNKAMEPIQELKDLPERVNEDFKRLSEIAHKDGKYTASDLVTIRRLADKKLGAYKVGGSIRPEVKATFDDELIAGHTEDLRGLIRSVGGDKIRMLDKDIQVANEMRKLVQENTDSTKIKVLDWVMYNMASGGLKGLATVAGSKFLLQPEVRGRLAYGLQKLHPSEMRVIMEDGVKGSLSPKSQLILKNVFVEANRDLSRSAFQFALRERAMEREKRIEEQKRLKKQLQIGYKNQKSKRKTN